MPLSLVRVNIVLHIGQVRTNASNLNNTFHTELSSQMFYSLAIVLSRVLRVAFLPVKWVAHVGQCIRTKVGR